MKPLRSNFRIALAITIAATFTSLHSLAQAATPSQTPAEVTRSAGQSDAQNDLADNDHAQSDEAHDAAASEREAQSKVQSEGALQPLTRRQFLDWGVETHEEIVATMQVPNKLLLVETAHADGSTSGGVDGHAFAWPLSAQFRVYNSLAQMNPEKYARSLRTFSDQFHREYWSRKGGYYCTCSGGDRFYDDNAHIAVALVEAYEITGEQIYLDRAIKTFDFLLEGETPDSEGGSYWSVEDHTFFDSAAVIQGARAALMLYQATEDQKYLEHAKRRYQWARDTTQVRDGVFQEKLFLTGPKQGKVGNHALVHFAGYGIATNVLFYEVTKDSEYLKEAQRIANASLRRYFSRRTGYLRDEGYWAYELVDSLIELYEVDGDRRWFDAVVDAMQWVNQNKRDPAGHYGRLWGRGGKQSDKLDQWDLNDQAPVACAYLRIGLARLPGDFDADGDVDGADFQLLQQQGNDPIDHAAWERNYGQSSTDPIGSIHPRRTN